MTDEALARKLLVKPGYRVLLLAAPDGYAARLQPLATTSSEPGTGFDVVQVFARDQQELAAHAPAALGAAASARAFWACYLKGGARAGTDINRDRGWDALTGEGWVGVSLVAIDDRWAAMRFRREGDVGR